MCVCLCVSVLVSPGRVSVFVCLIVSRAVINERVCFGQCREGVCVSMWKRMRDQGSGA